MKGLYFLCLLFVIACQTKTTTPKDCIKSGLISHFVLLDTKDSLSHTQVENLISKLNLLANIPQVQFFEIGRFEDLDDPRALKEYDYVIQMEFANQEDYKIYQKSEIHLGVKKTLGEYLAGPPASYDYRID